MFKERRRHSRLSVTWKATIVRLNGEKLPGSTDNVAPDGLNVILSKELVLGEPVRIELVTPRCHGTRFFKLDAVIVYSRQLEHNLGHAVGVRLLQPGQCYQQCLLQLETSVGVA
ncbi:PilZ domain-containing protein [Motiliproteus sp.]|uniref:PilZ domain-containing protein n=1 Tax=Motiliproteus sp. TaxID=1898955 RepID=UPI003BAC4842